MESDSCGTFGVYIALANDPGLSYTDNVENNKCYEYKYEIKDDQNNIAEFLSPYPLKVDTTTPSFTLYSPINNTIYPADIVINSSNALDNQGIAEYKYSLNEGAYENLIGYPAVLVDGNYNLTIYAKDYAGLTKTETVYFTIDQTYPIITVSSPIESRHYNSNFVTLDYSVNENTAWVKYSIDNQTNVTISGSTSITNLPDGEHNLTIYAEDTAGWVSEKKIKFYTDTIEPQLEIYVPHDSGVYGSSLVIGYITDEKLSKAEYELDNNPKTPLGLHEKLESLSAGQHTLTIYIEDLAENNKSKTISFSVDLTLPYLIITSPTPSFYGTDHITLEYNTNKNLTFLGYALDNDIPQSAQQNQLIQGLGEGQHTLILGGMDPIGTEISANVTFNIDLTKPVLNVSSPINRTYPANTIPLQYTAYDDNLDKVSYSINGGAEIILDGNTNLNLADGDYSLLVEATDKAGNKVNQMIDFSIDTVKPVVEIYSPVQTLYFTGDIEISYSVSKLPADITYFLNGAEVQDLNNLEPGAYNFLIEAEHNSGNIGRNSVSFVVISAEIISPLNQTNYFTNTIEFSYNSSDNIDKHSYVLDNRREKLLKESNGSRIFNLNSGWHNLTLYAYYQGIINSKFVRFRTGIKDLSVSNGDISLNKAGDDVEVNITIWNMGDYDVDKVNIKYVRDRDGQIQQNSIRIIELYNIFSGTSQSIKILDDEAELNDIMHIFIDPEVELTEEQRHNNYAAKLYNFRPEIEGAVSEFMGEFVNDAPLYNPIYVLPTDIDDDISRVEFILPNGLKFVDSDSSDGWTFDLDMSFIDKHQNYIDIIAYDSQNQASAVTRKLFNVKEESMIALPAELQGLWKDLFELYTLIKKIIDLQSKGLLSTEEEKSSMSIQEAQSHITIKELIEKPYDIACYDSSDWVNCEFLASGKLEKIKATCEDSNYVRFKLDKGYKTLFDNRVFESEKNVYTYDADVLIKEPGEYKLAVSCNGAFDEYLSFYIKEPSMKIESQVYEKLEEEEEAHVIIVLKDKRMSLTTMEKGVLKIDEEALEVKKGLVKAAQDNVLSTLTRSDFRLEHKYKVTSTITGFVTDKGLQKLKDDPNVESIYIDRKVYPSLTQSTQMINAGYAWGLGYTGNGQTVCVIDSGIDYTHPDLGGCSPGDFFGGNCNKVIDGWDYYTPDNNPIDIGGHGTHVAGIVAANGVLKGVAPDAKLVALRALGPGGGSLADVGASIDWCNAHKSQYNISVITMSLGDVGEYNDSNCPTALNTEIAAAHNLGIFVSVASGNDEHQQGISYPACAPYSVSVGAADKDDVIADFTNRANNLDLLAPGVEIYSTYITPKYVRMSGTSMATPHVAGAAALLKQYNPSLTPAGIENRLKNGIDIYDNKTGLTFPRIDISKTVSSGDILDDIDEIYKEVEKKLKEVVEKYKKLPIYVLPLFIKNEKEWRIDRSSLKGFQKDMKRILNYVKNGQVNKFGRVDWEIHAYPLQLFPPYKRSFEKSTTFGSLPYIGGEKKVKYTPKFEGYINTKEKTCDMDFWGAEEMKSHIKGRRDSSENYLEYLDERYRQLYEDVLKELEIAREEGEDNYLIKSKGLTVSAYGNAKCQYEPDFKINEIRFMVAADGELLRARQTIFGIPYIAEIYVVVIVDANGWIEGVWVANKLTGELEFYDVNAELGLMVGAGAGIRVNIFIAEGGAEVYIIVDGRIVLLHLINDPEIGAKARVISGWRAWVKYWWWGWHKREWSGEFFRYEYCSQNVKDAGLCWFHGGTWSTKSIQSSLTSRPTDFKLRSFRDDPYYGILGKPPGTLSIKELSILENNHDFGDVVFADKLPDYQPVIASNKNKENMVVWMHVPNVSKEIAEPIIYSSEFKIDNWTTPKIIPSGPNLKTSPSIIYDSNSNLIALWMDDKTNYEEDINITFDEWMKSQEIYYSVYNRYNWTTSQQITDNGYLEAGLDLSSNNNGDVIAVWLSDKDANISTIDDIEVYSSIWNGLEWAAPKIINQNSIFKLNPQIEFTNDQTAMIVWEQDGDNLINTTSDMELYYSVMDTSSMSILEAGRITNNNLTDEVPRLIIANNKPTLLWQQEELVTTSLIVFNESSQTSSVDYYNSSYTRLYKSEFDNGWSSAEKTNIIEPEIINPQLLKDSQDNLVLLWDSSGKYNTGGVSYTIKTDNNWTTPKQLIDSQLTLAATTASIDSDDNLMLLWLAHNMTLNKSLDEIYEQNLSLIDNIIQTDDDLYYLKLPLKPDVKISLINVSNKYPNLRDNVNITVVVENSGELDADDDIILEIKNNGISVHTANIGSLLSSESTNVTINFNVNEIENNITAYAHYDARETSKGNNNKELLLEVLPDLFIEEVSSSKQKINGSEEIEISARVDDLRRLLEGNVSVEFYLNTINNDSIIGIKNFNLLGDEYATLNYRLNLNETGEYVIYAVVNRNKSIREAYYSNNIGSVKLQMLPDLVAKNLFVLSNIGGLQVQSVIKNTGSVPISNITVELYNSYPFTNNNLLATKEINGVKSDETLSLLFGINTELTAQGENSIEYVPLIEEPIPEGDNSTDYVYLIVDPNNRLKEVDETNNFVTIRNNVTKFTNLRIQSNDLEFISEEGGTTSVVATIHNIGDTTAFFVDVALFDSKDNLVARKYIDYIEPNEEKEVTFEVKAEGEYKIFIDRNYDLNELKRNDNEIIFQTKGVAYNIQCNNGSDWISCSDLKYNDTIDKVRATCSNSTYTEFRLANNYDNITFFDNVTHSNISNEWTFDNQDVTITDSGEWELFVNCSDNSQSSLTWQIDWGTIEVYLKQPNSSINVSRNGNFYFTSAVKCIDGECTNITAVLDPISDQQSSSKNNAELIDKLSKNQEVPVIITLKDEPTLRALSNSENSKAKDDLTARKKRIKDTQNRFLRDIDYVVESKPSIKNTMNENSVSYNYAIGPLSSIKTAGKNNIDFKLKHRYNTMNAIAGKITREGFLNLKDNPKIEKIYLDRVKHTLLSESVPMIRANDAWALGYTGKNQTACIIDTGIDYRHPDLGNCSSSEFLEGKCSKVIGGYDYYNVDNNPIDDNGHGTHIAAIVAANGTIKGVAPNAKLVALKACDNTGDICYDSDIQAAFDWCINNASKFNISVISLSLGDEQIAYNQYCNGNLLANSINAAVGQNILVAVAAGNSLGSSGIGSPACVENATSVSGVDDSDNIRFDRSPILDLLAPAVNIYSPTINGAYGEKDGTSMAAPHIAGAVLLLREYNNNLTPIKIETILKNSGVSVYDTETALTFPRVDIYNALNYLINTSSIKEAVKGRVSTNPNATPFYTDINPRNSSHQICLANLKADETCEQTWKVTATGNVNSTYEFFVIYTSEHPEITNLETERINITIIKPYRRFTFNLTRGWNLISIPLNLTNNTLPEPFKSIEGNYSHGFTYADGKWYPYYAGESTINKTMEPIMGFWINMTNDDMLKVEGYVLENFTFDLDGGWNLIGYPYLEQKNISELFNNVTVRMYNNSKWYSYDSKKPYQLNTLDEFTPGFGYWVDVK